MAQPWINTPPQHWSTYVPQPDDFATTEEYVAALEAGSQDTSPQLNNGWVNSRMEREPAFAENAQYHPPATERSYGAKKLNWLFGDTSNNQRLMTLQGFIRNAPELARAAYEAYDANGNPLIDPGVAAIIERTLGIGPAPEQPGQLPVNGAGTPNLPDQGMPAPGGANPNKPMPTLGGGAPSGGWWGGYDNKEDMAAAAQAGPQDAAPSYGGGPSEMGANPMSGGYLVPDDVVMRIRARFGKGGRGVAPQGPGQINQLGAY